MELYDSKYVYFDWDDKLKGKKGFFADNIDDLKQAVKGNKIGWFGEILKSSDSDSHFPFETIDEDGWHAHLRFCYYDPYYEFRKAYLEGKQLQFKNRDDDWEDVDGEPLFTTDEYRIKPEWYIVLDDYGLSRTNSTKDEYVVFEGTEEECIEWMNKYKKFGRIMLAWKQGKTIQYKDDDEWVDWILNELPHVNAFDYQKEWRIKDECEEILFNVVFNDEGCLSVSHSTDKHINYVYFTGTIDECKKWIYTHARFTDVMKAWEEGKQVQWLNTNTWKDVKDNKPSWNYLNTYRIKLEGQCSDCISNKCANPTGSLCDKYVTESCEYESFDTVQELIDAWDEKYPQNKNRPEGTMPLIWVKNKQKNRVYLITDFLFEKAYNCDVGTENDNLRLKELFDDYTFVDGSIIGKVKE